MMTTYILHIKSLIREEAGITLIEYALLGFFISVTCVLVITTVGINVLNLYTVICNAVAAAIGGPAAC